ncbi:hypothetical protein FOYG_02950 [Fusarium oxysporum NRRL 32931]|uniref:Uncharacterized protein n=1 Tax=Fusarium oxysporum NRRL 32931 TaxID=660029 RepID=W9J0U5_FUSOX|nr:hypothetical protein FOYG_02950 [Fusarium oxysporum NRRL 32931]EWY98474.1 hypothetical protein FOYG_02950 [Fusarium oxysporum NRRL 32931]
MRAKIHPRWQGDNFRKNAQLVDDIEALAKKKGCTVSQIAINWLLSLSSPGDVYDRAHPWLYQVRPNPRERDNHRSYRRGLARYRQATCIFYACR